MDSKKKQLLIAVVILVVGVIGNKLYIDSRVSQYQDKKMEVVLRAKETIPAGTMLVSKMVESATIPEQFVPKAKIKWADRDQYLNQEVGVQVLKGDYILDTSFRTRGSVGRTLSQQLEGEDVRAITIPVDEINSFSRSIVNGDRVDILFTFQVANLKQKVSIPLLQNVPVLSTGAYSAANQELGEKGSQGGRYGTVTLQMSSLDAVRLNYARQNGTINLLLRSTRDSKALDVPLITGVHDVLTGGDRAKLEEIIKLAKSTYEVGAEKVAEQLRQAAGNPDAQRRILQGLQTK